MRQLLAQFLLCSLILAASSALVETKATTLTATITADSRFSAYLSTSKESLGERFMQDLDGWETIETGSVELSEDQVYYLHIVAGGPRAWPAVAIGSFSLSDGAFVFPNDSQSISTSAEHWKFGFYDSPGLYPNYLHEFSGPGHYDGIIDEFPPGTNFLTSHGATGSHVFTVVIIPNQESDPFYKTVYQPNREGGSGSIEEAGSVPKQFYLEEGNLETAISADPGRLSILLEDRLIVPNEERFASTSSEFVSSDFILKSESGLSTADISLNLKLRGYFLSGAGRMSAELESSISVANLELAAQIANNRPITGQATITSRHEIGTDNPTTETSMSEIGALIGVFPKEYETDLGSYGSYVTELKIDVDKTITTPTYSIAIGVPFQVKLNLTAKSELISNVPSAQAPNALSMIRFPLGLTFPTDRLVFNLPPGVTVDSIGANIRDNRFEISADSSFKDLVAGTFMRIPNIPGESKAHDHKDWIDLLELSNSLLRIGQGQSNSSTRFEDVRILKNVDKSSPKLLEALAQGLVFEEVAIEHGQQVSAGLWKQHEFLLHNVTVTDFQLHANQNNTLAQDSFSFAYDKIDWIYRLSDARGFEQGRVEAFWDIVANTGGSSTTTNDNSPPSVGQIDNQTVDPASTNLIDLAIEDLDTDLADLEVTVSTSRPDLISDLQITGTGAEQKISYKTSALRSGFASITVTVSDGKDSRSTSIPVLIDVEMTPYEGYLAAYFNEEERDDLNLTSPIRDPDKDNIPTAIEFLLGTNPNEFNRASEGIKTILQDSPDGRVFTVEFKKRLDEPNILGHLWGSSDLKTWQKLDGSNPIYEESTQQSENPLFQDTTATVTLPSENEQPFYLRFQAEEVF